MMEQVIDKVRQSGFLVEKKELISCGSLLENQHYLIFPQSKEASFNEPLLLEPFLDQLIIPLSFWLEHRAIWLSSGKKVAVCLSPEDEVESVLPEIDHFSLLAIYFPKFTEGRGYSQAVDLKQALQFKIELRAVGEIHPDQLFFLKRVGFDSVCLDQAALAMPYFNDFSDAYQGSSDTHQVPFYRH